MTSEWDKFDAKKSDDSEWDQYMPSNAPKRDLWGWAGMAVNDIGKGIASTVGLPMTAYNLIGRYVTTPAINAAQKAAGYEPTPYQDVLPGATSSGIQAGLKSMGVLDRPGTTPNTPFENVISQATQGAAGAAIFPGASVPSIVGGAGAGAAGELAGQATERASPGVQLAARVAASIVGGAATQKTSEIGKKTADSMFGGARQNPQYAAFDRQGVRPTPSDVTPEASTIGKIEENLSRSLGGGPLVRAAQGQARDFEARVGDLQGVVGPAGSKTATGQTIISGLENFRKRTKDTFANLDEQLMRNIPASTRVPTGNPKFVQLFDDMQSKYGADSNLAEAFKNKEVQSIVEAAKRDIAANGGTIGFGTLLAMRSRIGDWLSDKKVAQTIGEADSRRLYGAISEDIDAAIRASGNQSAINIANKRDSLWSAFQDRMKTLSPMEEANLPEQAYRLAMAGGRDGPTKLWKLRRSLQPQEWDDVAGTAFNLLGRDSEAANFSVQTFFKNITKMPVETRAALFGGPGKEQMASNLTDLAKISESVARGEKIALQNDSRIGFLHALSALSAGGAGLVGGAGTSGAAMAAAATTVAAPNIASRLLANRAFVAWLATPVPERQMSNHMLRLSRIASQSPEIEADIKAFAKELGQNGR